MKQTWLCIISFAVLFLVHTLCGAAEVPFPSPSYDADSLAKVREWEKMWARKKITTETVDQVKDYLHEAVYKVMKEPSIFGGTSFWFEIVPYRTYEISKGRIEATKTICARKQTG